ncbi:phosphoglycerate mutase-like protein [Coprinopsis marcescibilis]|uniref:Phosphoglycerate mutase-like protein n=1 Tax=Coprinopsis marcescibilis TaxID=230819 RepID=A0A5C3KZG8_COPMA|nr:phosphoglycerate mutase-like protein [Coprinopsis marcescibilis]
MTKPFSSVNNDPEVQYGASGATEREALLSGHQEAFEDESHSPKAAKPKCPTQVERLAIPVRASHVAAAFVTGIIACLLMQLAICGPSCFSKKVDGITRDDRQTSSQRERFTALAPPWVGSTEVQPFPPASPTNAFPSMFPTNVGYAGGTPTGAEPAVIATAPVYPYQSGQCSNQLIPPQAIAKVGTVKNHTSSEFKLFTKWGNLSPWYSVERGKFGIDATPEPPETCRVTGLHFLHRHGARYPTAWASYGGPAKLATKLNKYAKDWTATGDLDFLNQWTYKLGEELLTPFGRKQLFDLGFSLRMKYGFLLNNFTESNTIPVFRTESQDRMLASALNFAVGFFGFPYDGQYQQSITIEADGFNNTLAPYKTCPNANVKSKADRGKWYTSRWADIYLKDARERLQREIKDFDLTIEDVYIMQQTCSYETVALGYSKFCELFTEDEWEGFDYALDLYFWYVSAFGSPVARVQGIGWIQELVARLTKTHIKEHNTSTNATLHNDITFPLGQSLYVDATHEVVVLNIITALNLTTFAADGPLPYTHIPHNRAFRVAELAPFATNMQFQLLSCTSTPGEQIRVIINDGVAPLTGIRGCPEQKDGMCPVDTFVDAQKEIIAKTDWAYDCHGDWEVPEGNSWQTVTGDSPKP